MESFIKKLKNYYNSNDDLRLEKVIQLKDNKFRIFFSHSKLFLIRNKIRVLSSKLFDDWNEDLKRDLYRLLKLMDLDHLLWLIKSSFLFTYDYKTTLTIAYFKLKNHYTFIADIELIRKYYDMFDFDICKESRHLLRKYIIMCQEVKDKLTKIVELNKEQLIFIKYKQYFEENNNWKFKYFLNDLSRSWGKSKLIFTGKEIQNLEFKTGEIFGGNPLLFIWIPTKSELKTIIDKLHCKNKYTSIEKEYQNWRKRKKISIKCEELNYLAFLMKKKFKLIWEKDHSCWRVPPIILEFIINKYLSVKLENNINIYVENERFSHCKFLILNIPIHKIKEYDLIDSIDEAYDIQSERSDEELEISKEQEFWAHCSNLQVWFESNYDTRLLHSNLSFPLLRRLAAVGDPIAKKVYKDEICYRIESGHTPVIIYLFEEDYLDIFTDDEFIHIFHKNHNEAFFHYKIIRRLLKIDQILAYFLIYGLQIRFQKSVLIWKTAREAAREVAREAREAREAAREAREAAREAKDVWVALEAVAWNAWEAAREAKDVWVALEAVARKEIWKAIKKCLRKE